MLYAYALVWNSSFEKLAVYLKSMRVVSPRQYL